MRQVVGAIVGIVSNNDGARPETVFDQIQETQP